MSIFTWFVPLLRLETYDHIVCNIFCFLYFKLKPLCEKALTRIFKVSVPYDLYSLLFFSYKLNMVRLWLCMVELIDYWCYWHFIYRYQMVMEMEYSMTLSSTIFRYIIFFFVLSRVQWIDGLMDGRTDGWMNKEWINVKVNKLRMDAWMDGWMNVYMEKWIKGWINEWRDGWMNEWSFTYPLPV